MSNLTNNTSELRDILAAVNALPEAGGGTVPVIQPLNVTENATYTAPTGVDGYSPIVVNVPSKEPATEELSVTANGTYTPGNGVDGYSKVTVNVPTGGNTDMEDNLIMGTSTSYSNHRVTSVGRYFFYSQSNLKSVDLPNVTSIGLYSFQAAGLLSVTLPKLTSVAASAFVGCTSLVTADFHALTKIDILAFKNSSKFTSLILRNTSRVCTLSNVNAFTSTPIASGTGYIYVPRSLVDSYKAATNWSTYAAQIRAIEDYPDITGG